MYAFPLALQYRAANWKNSEATKTDKMISSTYQLEEGKHDCVRRMIRRIDENDTRTTPFNPLDLRWKTKGLNSCRVVMVRIVLRWWPGWNQIPIADILWTRDFSSREKTRKKKKTIVSYNSAVLDILTLQSHFVLPLTVVTPAILRICTSFPETSHDRFPKHRPA